MGQVTDLKQAILDYINMARRKPQLASDPDELANLENAALTSMDGAFAAQTAPVAPYSWEARTLFLASQAVSERIQLDIPFPCQLVGAYASLSPINPGEGAIAPTVDDIDCTIDLNTHEYMTNTQGTVTVNPSAQLQRDGTFVTLGSLSNSRTGGSRLMAWVIPYRTAQLGIIYRWKQGPNVYANTHVGLTFFARALQDQ